MAIQVSVFKLFLLQDGIEFSSINSSAFLLLLFVCDCFMS